MGWPIGAPDPVEHDSVKHNVAVLKVGGEAFSGPGKMGIDPEAVAKLTRKIVRVAPYCTLAIVVGGGNYFRGSIQGKMLGMDDTDGDLVGMLVTIVNGAALRNSLEHAGIDVRLQSSIAVEDVCEIWRYKKMVKHLFMRKRVVILAGGTGGPGCSTDTAAMTRARDIRSGMVDVPWERRSVVVLKGTNVDGVFDKDPNSHPDAERFKTLSTNKFLQLRPGKILDEEAVAKVQSYGIPIRVFNIQQDDDDLLLRIVRGEEVGSLITSR